ncbi:MAG: hypothetical protein AMXMBFR12_04240 [Candidatus Babeliales bacterium]
MGYDNPGYKTGMKLKIIICMLLYVGIKVGMESVADSSKRLHLLAMKVHTIVNKRQLIPAQDNFDASQDHVLPMVENLLKQGADPDWIFRLGRQYPEPFSIKLPTARELIQQINYKDIESLFQEKMLKKIA